MVGKGGGGAQAAHANAVIIYEADVLLDVDLTRCMDGRGSLLAAYAIKHKSQLLEP